MPHDGSLVATDAPGNADVVADAELDLRMTADRAETKHVVAAEVAAALGREIGRHLPPHHFRGPGATILPGGLEYSTTIYFDTAQRQLYDQAVNSAAHLKLRAREYYSVHPALTDLATDARELVRYTPLLWLEIKHKDGARTRKQRLGIPKRDVARFFETGSVTAEMIELARPEHGAEAAEVLADVANLCRRFETPLRPDCLVNYRRSGWQDPQGGLRITVDRAVAFFAPPDDLFTRDFALVRETLGEPAASFGAAVLEIKARSSLPEWLECMLAEHRLPPHRFSKFVAASQAVHG
jgi:hypothetical protein